MNGAMIRQPRYATSSASKSLKCHGVFSPLILRSSPSVGASPRPNPPAVLPDFVPVVSIRRPHAGQLPSGVIADGAKYREHGSHQGIVRRLVARS
jgi:hypothetical protein